MSITSTPSSHSYWFFRLYCSQSPSNYSNISLLSSFISPLLYNFLLCRSQFTYNPLSVSSYRDGFRLFFSINAFTSSYLACHFSSCVIQKYHPHSRHSVAIVPQSLPLPAQTSRPPEAVASSVYPAAPSSLGRLCGTNTYLQNSQTPFRIDFNFSLFILDLQSRLLTLGKA